MNSRLPRLATLSLVLGLSFAFPAFANAALGGISGTVTAESGGAALSNICVGARGPSGEIRSTFTNSSGDYTLSSLAAGNWKLGFNPPGCPGSPWATEYWDNRTSEAQADPIAVVDDVTRDDIDAQLAGSGPPPPTGGSISGIVTDGSGNPISSLCVGVRNNSTGQTAGNSTNSSGQYLISGLAAGQYTLQFNCTGGNLDWTPEYWEDTLELSQADAITVAADQPTTGISASLVPAGKISGTVSAEGAPASGVCVQALDNDTSISRQTISGLDGTYTVSGLAPGDYKLGFSDCFVVQDDYAPQWWDGEATSLTADPIAVAIGETVTGKNADLTEGGEISGTVTASGGPLADACVTAERDGNSPVFDRTDPNGDYTLPGLGTGSYTVSFSDCDPADPLYANEVYNDVQSGADATPVPVTAPDTTEGIDAELVPAGRLEGDLTLEGGAPADRACVGAFRPGDAQDLFDLNNSTRFAIADANGHYVISDLQPGTYKVAFSDCEVGFQANPPYPGYATEMFDERSTFADADAVAVPSGGTVTASATLAPGGRIRGTISDANGPLSGACVTAEDPDTGEVVAATQTFLFGNGAYRLTGIPVGDWLVKFFTSGDCPGDATGYQSEYHDNAGTRAAATPVTVNANAATGPIDAVLEPDPAPETQITSGPAEGSSSANDDPAFAFESNEGSATFECSLDGSAFAACTSPRAYTNVAAGSRQFRVRAVDESGQADPTPATRTWTVNPASTTETSEGEVEEGGTVTTDPAGAGATPSQPTTAAVTVPDGGEVTITTQAAGAPPAGFNFLGRQFEIEAPDATEEEPLVLTFVLDASAIPGGTHPQTVQVMRDGAAAGDCTQPVSAAPDPCVASRTVIAGGDLRMVVRSSHASTWNLGVAAPAPAGKCRVPLLLGRKLADAKTRITAAKCKLGTVKTVRTRLVPKDIVLLQKPLPWLVKPANTAIDLWVSARP